MHTGTFRGFDVLFSTKNCSAADWYKFWTDFTTAFAWEGTVLMLPTSENGTEKVTMSLCADMENFDRAVHLLMHHGFKNEESSTGETQFESPERIPAVDISAQQSWFELRMLCDGILNL
ncbi:unnamed protein product [Clonostachys byssicola]|uniref:Uncharacterized protein n=1 Tax=Clonostachys byssicola TaxID=160290 RepID=A0A9N9XXQ8_9HYPO|nr:unnamed protein product [Clonostachys byssicola]